MLDITCWPGMCIWRPVTVILNSMLPVFSPLSSLNPSRANSVTICVTRRVNHSLAYTENKQGDVWTFNGLWFGSLPRRDKLAHIHHSFVKITWNIEKSSQFKVPPGAAMVDCRVLSGTQRGVTVQDGAWMKYTSVKLLYIFVIYYIYLCIT